MEDFGDRLRYVDRESELLYKGHCVAECGALEAVDGPGSASTSVKRSRLCKLEGEVSDKRYEIGRREDFGDRLRHVDGDGVGIDS